MLYFSNEVLIRRRIGVREPVLNVLLQPVAYKDTVGHGDEMRKEKQQTLGLIYFV